jgi:hypothetical protein
MSESRHDELIRDLARLLAKYGPDAFEALAGRLRDGRLQNDLLALLEASTQAGRQTTRPLGGKSKSQRQLIELNELLKQIGAEDPKKSDALKQLHEKLVSKKVLPSLRHIRDFAQDNGLPRITSTSRDKAIIPLMRAMMSLPYERIVSALERSSLLEEKSGRSLEGWTGVILGKRDRGTSEKR